MKKYVPLLLLGLALLGLADASYLGFHAWIRTIVPCSLSIWADCGKVLQSPYSSLFGQPLWAWGILHYVVVMAASTWLWLKPHRQIWRWLGVQTTAGLVMSGYFVWLQLVVIKAICLYCMFSALVSTFLWIGVWLMSGQGNRILLWLLAVGYQLVKRVLFLWDAETVHEAITASGEVMGNSSAVRKFLSLVCVCPRAELVQEIAGVEYSSPVGLSAGFDYCSRLTRLLPSLGFGFQSVGTITALPCAGNPQPRLARLPASRSLLVNKGFRNPGIKATVAKLEHTRLTGVVGISIGQTNTTGFTTRSQVIADIVSSFRMAEKSRSSHCYYELNISCPNLNSPFHFYQPKQLAELLNALDALKLTRPVWVKMPINESDENTLSLLKVIARHSCVGVIIGNLQKDRSDKSIVASELRGLGRGNLSGKPTWERSNHLISLAFQHFHPRLKIIGCGGVFSAEDAYIKIKLGASLIQLVTGLVYQGPQLVAEINAGLVELLARDGYGSVREAVGTAHVTRK